MIDHSKAKIFISRLAYSTLSFSWNFHGWTVVCLCTILYPV